MSSPKTRPQTGIADAPRRAGHAGLVLLAGAALTLTGSVTPAVAETGNGNPGTIKIAYPTANGGADNDAKPGCSLRLDFYGFLKNTYQVTFKAIAPTGTKQVASGTVTVTQERTPASNRQTGQVFALDVSGLQPSNAGYHIRVDVTNPNKPGNGAKTKNFYFDCVPGQAVGFAGGSGSLGDAQGDAQGAAQGAVPVGGFDTGGGGTSALDFPLLPATGLLAGLGLLTAAGVLRRRPTS